MVTSFPIYGNKSGDFMETSLKSFVDSNETHG